MAISERKRTCFVIMPFGEKKDLDGKDIDFDDIYRFFFKKAIEDLGIECIRCDEIEEAGSIHEKMFEDITLPTSSWSISRLPMLTSIMSWASDTGRPRGSRC